MDKPAEIFNRGCEWQALAQFVAAPTPGLTIGVVYGRRRVGKTFLLRRLTERAGGVYAVAYEEDRAPALRRFGEALRTLAGVEVAVRDWEHGFETLVALANRSGAPPVVLALDEFPFLLRHSPELTSVLQHLHDRLADDAESPRLRIILCGSSLAVMSELLSGQQPLRGRAQLVLRVEAFDYLDAAAFWGVSDDPELAFRLHALVGGVAGHRRLIGRPAPATVDELGAWIVDSVLSPPSALFGEADYLLREDPRIAERARYQSILAAIAEGRHRPVEIGSVLGRSSQELSHPLEVLRTGGFVDRVEDVLFQRKSNYMLADPIVRLLLGVARPHQLQLEDGHGATVWDYAQPTVSAQIYGPHFESLCRTWLQRYAPESVTGGPLGEVGPTQLPDRSARQAMELDAVGLVAGERGRQPERTVALVGEAKFTAAPLGLDQLGRLDRAVELIGALGHDAGGARRLLLSRSGFTSDLLAAQNQRPEVVLVDLDQLYTR